MSETNSLSLPEVLEPLHLCQLRTKWMMSKSYFVPLMFWAFHGLIITYNIITRY